MKGKNKWLFWNSVILTLYLVFGYFLHQYLIEKAEIPLVIGVFFIALLVIHFGFMILATLLQWIGYLKSSKGIIIFTSILLLIGGAFAYYTLIGFIPFAILNILSVYLGNRKEPGILE